MSLAVIWFILVFVLLTGYAVLDGFDLGVGVLHLLVARTNTERRLTINSIAPVWDGNEVWLLTGGGALFAAFPSVYATVFSGFYIALMLLLVALMARAVSMEFRGKVESDTWRKIWDVGFAVGSILPPILFGVALGNVLRGLPINSAGDFTGTFLGLLNPYSILVGVLTLVVFTMHGAIYLSMKSTAELHTRATRVILPLWAASVALYALATLATAHVSPFLFATLFHSPIAWVLIAALLISLPAVLASSSAVPVHLARRSSHPVSSSPP